MWWKTRTDRNVFGIATKVWFSPRCCWVQKNNKQWQQCSLIHFQWRAMHSEAFSVQNQVGKFEANGNLPCLAKMSTWPLLWRDKQVHWKGRSKIKLWLVVWPNKVWHVSWLEFVNQLFNCTSVRHNLWRCSGNRSLHVNEFDARWNSHQYWMDVIDFVFVLIDGGRVTNFEIFGRECWPKTLLY